VSFVLFFCFLSVGVFSTAEKTEREREAKKGRKSVIKEERKRPNASAFFVLSSSSGDEKKNTFSGARKKLLSCDAF